MCQTPAWRMCGLFPRYISRGELDTICGLCVRPFRSKQQVLRFPHCEHPFHYDCLLLHVRSEEIIHLPFACPSCKLPLDLTQNEPNDVRMEYQSQPISKKDKQAVDRMHSMKEKPLIRKVVKTYGIRSFLYILLDDFKIYNQESCRMNRPALRFDTLAKVTLTLTEMNKSHTKP